MDIPGKAEVLVEIEDLMINFYTYQGIVKAIDGISLQIYKGETLGIVGETGCGKSVTANSIMRLILTPPGKIESGSIYFLEPKIVSEMRHQYERDAQSWYEKQTDAERKKLFATYSPRFIGFKKKASKRTPAEVNELVPSKLAPHALKAAYMKNKIASVQKTDQTACEALSKNYDLLGKSTEFMQKIRGKYISMIFQEPTSALNPVFTVGDQIAEVILLHRSADMAKRVLKRYETELSLVQEKSRPRKTSIEAKVCSECGKLTDVAEAKCSVCGHESFVEQKSGAKKKKIFKCSICNSNISKEQSYCDKCGNEFYGPMSWKLRKILISRYRRIFEIISKNPDSKEIKLISKIPILKRYKKELYEEALREAVKMLQVVRIPDPASIAYRYPHELSGGMQQRVLIAIALACNPRLLIADEPTTALDVTIQAQILKLMRDLKKTYGSSILLITHNLGVVAEMCDRVGVMYAGTMAEIGDVVSIFKSPLHPYTIGLMKAVPTVHIELDRLNSIRGSVPNLITPPSGCRFHPRCDSAKPYCTKVKPELVEIEPGHFVSCHKVSGAEGYV
jgi:peptide/nickel transport system ATP-binding protein